MAMMWWRLTSFRAVIVSRLYGSCSRGDGDMTDEEIEREYKEKIRQCCARDHVAWVVLLVVTAALLIGALWLL
jgi:hypothetical protein